MKKIHLIRHAKSSWDTPGMADIDRPLNHRGIKSCRKMAKAIHDNGCQFINVFCSPAQRAQSTIQLISEALPELAIQWQTDNRLYTFNSANLFDWCHQLDESVSEVMIVGHNPAFTDFCNALSQSNIDNIPTCAYVCLEDNENTPWKNLKHADFSLLSFIRPKELAS